MNYREFITDELARDLKNIYGRMNEMNIISDKQKKASIDILNDLDREIKKENKD